MIVGGEWRQSWDGDHGIVYDIELGGTTWRLHMVDAPAEPDRTGWWLTPDDGRPAERISTTHGNAYRAIDHATMHILGRRHDGRPPPREGTTMSPVHGNGYSFDPATGRLRLVARLTADYDVTVPAHRVPGLAERLAKLPEDADRDAVDAAIGDVLGTGHTLRHALGYATGGGTTPDLDRADDITIELDNQPPD